MSLFCFPVFVHDWDTDLNDIYITFAAGINWAGQQVLSDQIMFLKDVRSLKGKNYIFSNFIEK